MTNNERQDLVILGGGVGGLIVASVAGQLGLKVTLIEKADSLGGDCLHHGCVPSKTLIHSAKVASLMRRGEEFGLPGIDADIHLGRVMKHVADVVAAIQEHDDPERFRGYGCEVIFGSPRFLDSHRVEVNDKTISGRRFVIATGAGPAVPPVEGLDRVKHLTNRTVFSHDKLPNRLLVLGGGPIGVELAQAFLRLGSQVALVEQGAHLVPKEDPDVSTALREQLMREGMEVHTDSSAQRIQSIDGTLELECKGGLKLKGDTLLVALGRKPNIEGLGLEAAGVAHDKRGIEVDSRLRTSQKHIFACGDVCGPYPFTHMAEYQAGIVISNAVFRWPKKVDYSVVPWVTYTDPEVARVGLNETQANEQGVDYKLLRFNFKDVDRALAEVEPHGYIKMLIRKNRILGATILGPQAGELVHEIVLAMQAKVKLGTISAAIHVYPTLAQITRRAVNTYYGEKLFSPRTKKLVGVINRLIP
ncbi:MAG: FAD-dependent oxidoreductase [Gammaproteobacteria bacterium]|nr:FAD-dependent oxidoreductase [Gammaproteobacteria bacterium]